MSSRVVVKELSEYNKSRVHVESTRYQYNVSDPNIKTRKIYAVYGIIPLMTQSYLIIVIDAEIKSEIGTKQIYLAKKFAFIPLKNLSTLSIDSKDSPYIKMLEVWLNIKSFFFSYDYDLTSSLQKNLKENNVGIYSKSKSDYCSHFWYNECYMKPFLDAGIKDWIHPFVCGFLESKLIDIQSKQIRFTLLSRRDKSRAGLRFLNRGADKNGHVSNFAETEQILTVFGEEGYRIFSYMQIRGTIPFLWTQTPDCKWMPNVQISQNVDLNKEVYKKHLQFCLNEYRDVTMINLVDNKPGGFHQKLGQKFAELNKEYPSDRIKLIWFDFQAITKGLKFSFLIDLLEEINDNLDSNRYYDTTCQNTSIGHVENVTIEQTGVFRTNCIDCLDRTNVVQSIIARKIILRQLYQVNLCDEPTGSTFEHLPDELEDIFREIWTENANCLSYLYSGTGALLTDITRKGKITRAGSLEDKKRIFVRYILGNYCDPYYENSLDLLLGKVNVHDLESRGKSMVNQGMWGCFKIFG